MSKGYVQVFCGKGEGKSSAAIGKGILSAIDGKNVIFVQFLKEKNENETKFFQRLEPEIRLFRFERRDISFAELSDEQKKDEVTNIRNGLNYAKKVLSIGECDVLILDEVLGLIDEGIIECDDLIPILEARTDDVAVLLTGIVMPEELRSYVDSVSAIETVIQDN